MSIFRKLTSLALGVVVAANAFAGNMAERTSEISELSWKVRDLSIRLMESKAVRDEYNVSFKDFYAKSRSLAEELVENNQWKEFSDFYKELDQPGKQNLEFVVEGVIEATFGKNVEKDSSARAEQYFPGYGYSKPGYVYRRGQELKREFLQAYWKDEVIDEESTLDKELTMELSLAIKFKIELGEAVQELGKFDIDIDEKIVQVMKIKIHKSLKIHTVQKRKIGVEKVWFELFEAKKKWFGDLDWALVGKTFQQDTAPTGEAVVMQADITGK